MQNLLSRFLDKPAYYDVFSLSGFIILITLQPFFIHGELNFFEEGLYLPGIQAVLDGEVPFRDFFHLRGPFELYMPAFMMKVGGIHIKHLSAYFYFGNVLCLMLCALIAKEIFKTRGMLYLMVPVLVARAFPRVVFTYWGGMRYAFGLLTLWFVVKFFKTQKISWLFWAGIAAAAGMLTSFEMGVYPSLGLVAALFISFVLKRENLRFLGMAIVSYVLGMGLILIPYSLYLIAHGALFQYLDSVFTIVTNMQNVIDPHLVSVYPSNFPEAFAAMINPGHTNFKHLTPSYTYLFILGYLVFRWRRQTLSKEDLFILCLGIYGFIMYNTGFRGLWAAQFEMSLQPEKILLFFVFELLFLEAVRQRQNYKQKRISSQTVYPEQKIKFYLANAFILILIASSIGYSIQRYHHRFFAFKFLAARLTGRDTESLKDYRRIPSQALRIERAKGVMVPMKQAEELEAIGRFVKENVEPDEKIFTYPELGIYNFFVDRRFVGRFPYATFAWFNERWQKELITDLRKQKPRYVFLQKQMPEEWHTIYLSYEFNRRKHEEIMDFIQKNYRKDQETPLSYILKIKER